MKVLYIIESLKSGGKERRFTELIKGLKNLQGFNCEIIILAQFVHYKEIFITEYKIHYLKRTVFKDLLLFIKFRRILKNCKPDIVHCWDNIAAFQLGPIVKLSGLPFINSSISAAPPRLSIFSKRLFANIISYPFSDIILANSEAGLASFRVPNRKGIFIHNGIDLKRFNNVIPAIDMKERFRIKTKFIVGMVAAFTKLKDYNTFFKAAEIILSRRQDISFVTVGDGKDFIHFRGKYNNHQNIFFLGEQTEVEAIVNMFDIGVLATFSEGISNSIMEYMIMGKPVIANKGGGTSELIIDGETGFLIEPGQPELLADKIRFLLEHKEMSDILGKKGRDRMINEFSLEKMVVNTHNIYKEVLSERNA